MAESIVMQSGVGTAAEAERKSPFDRLASFRVLYLAIFAFMLLYILSVELAETILHNYFQVAVKEATRVSPTDGPIVPQIYSQVGQLIHDSPWVTIGGVRVQVMVLGADGLTPLYVGSGRVISSVPPPSLDAAMYEAVRLLPAISDVFVSVPHGAVLSTGIFMLYGAVLLVGLFFYNRAVAQREAARLAGVIRAREAAAGRARNIEQELSSVRRRLDELEPSERAHSDEIQALQRERASLRSKLGELAEREAELQAGERQRSTELEEERQALEELLEETLEDVNQKESEISELQDRLKSAAKKEPSGSSKSREAERLTRRMKTLYKNVAFDDRAIADLVGLRDEAMKLRAEEALKRLSDDSESAAVRRKVGGLPPQLSIFELGFAGKGRIYYSRGEGAAYRVLAIGAKNSQQKDMEYLSRLST
jgi:predicted  nucleic acid-binding Zn-ribbon protein